MYFKKPNSSFYDLQLENQTEQKKKKKLLRRKYVRAKHALLWTVK